MNNELGTVCHENISDISYLDVADTSDTGLATYTTFAMNGDALKVMFIVQLVFLCPMQCCAICGGGIGTAVLTMQKIQDDGFGRQ